MEVGVGFEGWNEISEVLGRGGTLLPLTFPGSF